MRPSGIHASAGFTRACHKPKSARDASSLTKSGANAGCSGQQGPASRDDGGLTVAEHKKEEGQSPCCSMPQAAGREPCSCNCGRGCTSAVPGRGRPNSSPCKHSCADASMHRTDRWEASVLLTLLPGSAVKASLTRMQQYIRMTACKVLKILGICRDCCCGDGAPEEGEQRSQV